MRIPLHTRSFVSVPVPRAWSVVCAAIAIALLALLLFHG